MLSLTYKVIWEIEVSASTPRKAAEEALAIQRDAFSTATVFSVIDSDGNETLVDLENLDE